MKTVEGILACVDSCTHADICDSDKHWCIYGDTGPDCVDRLEADYQEILGEVKKISTVARLKEICEAEREGRLVVLPNEPLTLDELLLMDGEPVWIVEHPEWGHWELSEDAEDYLDDRDEDFYDMTHNDAAGRYGLHALGWRAYRRKPHGAHP